MKIGIIGGGAMGGAFARGLLKSSQFSPDEIIISDPVTSHLQDLKNEGVEITSSNKEPAEKADFLVVAVKPWLVGEVISEIRNVINPEKTEICFIVAGIKAKTLMEMFDGYNPAKISIAIPNTAMALGESMTFIVPVNGKPVIANDLFGLMGKVMIIEERLLPGATALASCGLAYAMRYVRAACEGGVELGFKAAMAQEIITQTLAGVVALLRQDGSHPETEIDKVTTPGGITIRGLNEMERNGFTNAVIQGLKASVS